jgi:UPF0042 nucleotide-binding protein
VTTDDRTVLPTGAGGAALADPATTRVILVTGMSGAGKSSALKALEDIGYEAVDNLPISLLASLVGAARGPAPAGGSRPSGASRHPLAIGVDIRTRDFAAGSVLQEIEELVRHPGLEVKLLFLDAQDEALRRRYTETRRRHPLAGDRPLADGIRHERSLVAPLLARADVVIDTSDLTLGALQRVLRGHFGLDTTPGLSVFVTSFSYRNGVPREADIVFDVRFLANPHYVDSLRPHTGLDREVGRFIEADPDYAAFFASLTDLLAPLLPRFRQEGKSYLTIAIGCTGGRHRSVYIAERLAAWLGAQGQHASVLHRDLEIGATPGSNP